VTWTPEEWQEAAIEPDWGVRVADELRRYFGKGDPLLEAARLVNARVEVDSDGVPALLAVCDHPGWSERTWLRRRLNRMPFGAHDKDTPEASQAAEIAIYEISEPLGTYYYYSLVEDSSGVWWWGDGYPATGSGCPLPPGRGLLVEAYRYAVRRSVKPTTRRATPSPRKSRNIPR
jgi:hypothetical protein